MVLFQGGLEYLRMGDHVVEFSKVTNKIHHMRICGQTDRQTYIQTYIQTDRQTDRQTDSAWTQR